MNDQAFKDELKSWLRYNKRDDLVHMNGLSYSSFGAPNLPKFIAKPIISNALNAKSQNKADSKKIASSSHFVLFTIKAGSIEHWITLGRNLERFLLQSTGLGIANAHCNQPCEIVEISRQMAESLHISNEIPSILLRIGYANKMPYSKRIPIKVKTV